MRPKANAAGSETRRSQRGASELSQFPLVLYVLFLIVLSAVVELGYLTCSRNDSVSGNERLQQRQQRKRAT